MRTKSTGIKMPIVRFQHINYIKSVALLAVITLWSTTAHIVLADDREVIIKPAAKIELADESTTPSTNNTKIDFSLDKETNKSYLIPAIDIIGFDFLLNLRYTNEYPAFLLSMVHSAASRQMSLAPALLIQILQELQYD